MKKRTYKRTGNCGLFDWEEHTAKLDSLGNPLGKLLKVVNFEMFRETLEVGLYKEKLTNVGAKPYDYVLMFKILVLQRMYNLSDVQTEYQIVDHTSFRNFLGLASGDKVPDACWTKKGGQKFYGYKTHAKSDAKSKLIKKSVTPYVCWNSVRMLFFSSGESVR